MWELDLGVHGPQRPLLAGRRRAYSRPGSPFSLPSAALPRGFGFLCLPCCAGPMGSGGGVVLEYWSRCSPELARAGAVTPVWGGVGGWDPRPPGSRSLRQRNRRMKTAYDQGPSRPGLNLLDLPRDLVLGQAARRSPSGDGWQRPRRRQSPRRQHRSLMGRSGVVSALLPGAGGAEHRGLAAKLSGGSFGAPRLLASAGMQRQKVG